MTQIQEKLAALPEKTRQLFEPIFGSMENFYEVVYLIAKNEHLTEQDRPKHYEARLQVIREMRRKTERLISSFGLDGEELVADIASEYFEDYVAYRELPITLTNDQFLTILRRIADEVVG